MTGIPFGDVGERQFDHATALGRRHQRPLARQQLDQHACGEVVEQKHAWQGEGTDAVQPLANQSGAEAGALGGAHRQLRGQPTVNQRQTGLERLRRSRPLEQLGQDRQTVEQRVFGLGVAGGQRPGVGLSRAAGDGVQVGSGRHGARVLGPRQVGVRSRLRRGIGVLFGMSDGSGHRSRARVCWQTPLGIAQPNFPFR